MSEEGIALAVPFTENVRLALREAFPEGSVSVTRGRHYSLEETERYLVRGGASAVAMPRMKYSESVEDAVRTLYGNKEHHGGK